MLGYKIRTTIGSVVMIAAILAINYFVWSYIFRSVKSMAGQSQHVVSNTVCGNGICEDAACVGINCPFNENEKNCPKDCKKKKK